MLQTSTITQKGQVTIPYAIRQLFALETGTKVIFKIDENTITVSPLPSFFNYRGSIKSKKEFNIKKMRLVAQKHLSTRHGKNS